MDEIFVSMARLVLAFTIFSGPLFVLLWLLDTRDHRGAVLYGRTLYLLNDPELRGLFSIGVRSGWFSGRMSLLVDFWGCSRERLWETTKRLTESLPPEVRLIVNGMTTAEFKVDFSVEMIRKPPSHAQRRRIMRNRRVIKRDVSTPGPRPGDAAGADRALRLLIMNLMAKK